MPRQETLLALDFGTTLCKVSAFTTAGKVLCEFSEPNAIKYLGVGAYRQDVISWKAVLRRLTARASRAVSSSNLRAVSVTGQGSFPVCLDGGGRVLVPTLSHLDKRPLKHAKLLFEEFKGIGYVELKVFSALMWMKENHPEKFGSIRRVMDAKEYVGFLLSGEVTYDPKSFPTLQKICEFVGLDPSVFGRARSYLEPIGAARKEFVGRRQDGVPVEVGPNDGLCATLGSGAIERGTLADLTGTTEVIATAVPHGSKALFIPEVYPGVSMFYSSAPYGVIFEWFRANFYGNEKGTYALLESEARRTKPGAEGATFVISPKLESYFYDAKWSFVGLGLGHSRRHLARAVVECFAFMLARETEFLRSAGENLERIVASGGGATPRTVDQLKADVTGIPVFIPQTLNTTSLGSAMLGAVAVGVYGNLKDAVGGMLRFSREFRPDPTTSREYAGIKDAWEKASVRAAG